MNTFKRTFLIAEIGVNHNNNLGFSKKLIDFCSSQKVDAVKFQTFKTENYVNEKEKKRFKRLKKFELT